MLRLYMYIWVAATICGAAGCGIAPVQPYDEPSAIVIRNNSGTDIEKVSLRAPKKQNRYVPMGAISPLPAGVSQIVGRSSNPPRLPNAMTICWKVEDGLETCTPVDLKTALKGKSSAGGALVFEVLEQSKVKVYREDLQNNGIYR